MKKGLVLAGGGTRGAYQNGAIRALREIGKDNWDLVTGTSIGALNAAMVVQRDYAAMDHLWKNLTQDQIISGPFIDRFDLSGMITDRNLFASFFKNYIQEKGADVTPLKQRIHELYNPERFFASPVDFGCITVHHINQDPVFVTKEMMRKNGEGWLLASASAFPAFPVCHFDDADYVDGGYYDNLPVDLAMRMGARKLIIIDLSNEPKHSGYLNHKGIHYIFPKFETGSFLSFDRPTLDMLDICGYNDTMKEYGIYTGVRYTFKDMELPDYVTELVRQIMMLDTRIKNATNINERFRSETVNMDWLRSEQHRPVLTDGQIFFGLLDQLMSLLSFNMTSIYEYHDVRNSILASFANCAYEDYPYQPALVSKDMVELVSGRDRLGVIGRMVHAALYPSHVVIPENVALTLAPHEQAMADLVLCMMNELRDE